VARHRARGLLRNAAPDHVADARAPEVTEEQAGDAGRFGERIPCYAEVFDPSPFSRVKIMAFLDESYHPAFVVFRFARVEGNGVVEQVHLLGDPRAPATRENRGCCKEDKVCPYPERVCEGYLIFF